VFHNKYYAYLKLSNIRIIRLFRYDDKSIMMNWNLSNRPCWKLKCFSSKLFEHLSIICCHNRRSHLFNLMSNPILALINLSISLIIVSLSIEFDRTFIYDFSHMYIGYIFCRIAAHARKKQAWHYRASEGLKQRHVIRSLLFWRLCNYVFV